MKYDGYADLRDGLMDLPMTWYPALIITMIKSAYIKKVFKKGGASEFVRTIEKDWNYPVETNKEI